MKNKLLTNNFSKLLLIMHLKYQDVFQSIFVCLSCKIYQITGTWLIGSHMYCYKHEYVEERGGISSNTV